MRLSHPLTALGLVSQAHPPGSCRSDGVTGALMLVGSCPPVPGSLSPRAGGGHTVHPEHRPSAAQTGLLIVPRDRAAREPCRVEAPLPGGTQSSLITPQN